MASNEAYFSVSGFVATQPRDGQMPDGTPTLSFRVGWTPRGVSRSTGEWADLPSSFASVTCYRKMAEHASLCLRRGDAIVLKGTLRVREYADQAGVRRNSVDINADFLGHDLAKGTSQFSRQRRHAELTAAEYKQSQATRRDRLPGDAAEGEPDSPDAEDALALTEVGALREVGALSEMGEPGQAEDAELADRDREDEPGQAEDAELADRDREDEPVGAGL
jgi:single-strand DNA-binding protein